MLLASAAVLNIYDFLLWNIYTQRVDYLTRTDIIDTALSEKRLDFNGNEVNE